ncbi:MAG TPA: GntR family transcriptional regulator [Reyranella sp.]|nr:GntR family transcriptional regulator [Reyranella sp.]
MNAGGTMLRVYEGIRRRVVTGGFAPGERLEPARLAEDLHASVTPVRDALHRLTGERLIESWQQEGFRQILITEGVLRDLYRWSADLLALALKQPGEGTADLAPLEAAAPYPDRLAALFAHIACRHDNHEIRIAVENLNARLYRARIVEAEIWDDCDLEIAALVDHLVDPSALRRQVSRMHRRRLHQAGRIAARLRPHDDRRERH